MITSYEIKKQGSEEILYLYFDFNNEFGRINFKDKKEKLQNTIKRFIDDNKIAFTGTTVALIVGGTIVGNVILNSDKKETVLSNNIATVEKIELKPIEEIIEQQNIEETKIEIKDSEIENTNKKEVKSALIEDVTNISKNKEINSNSSGTLTTNSVQKEEKKVENSYNSYNKEDIKSEKQEDNNTYIKVKRSNGQILNLELEEYIMGVVGAEMPASFHNQALMAQAIIARTYALKANSKGQILSDNESTQSYKDNDELKSLWGSSYNAYYNKIKGAVISTKGMYLTYNGEYIDGNYFPYLVSVESPYDSLNPSFSQDKTITYQELSTKLNTDINIDTDFFIQSKTSGNRVENIIVNGKTYKGVEFRNLLGLRSADFDITKIDNGVIFTTRGYGHGVGLSQYGANGMAKNGYTFTDILTHYYRGVTINHL